LTDFAGLLRALASHDVEFIVVGGLAAIAHGSARTTQDIDIVYSRRPENLEKMVAALAPVKPYLRGAPAGLPFRLDVPTLNAGLNFTLITNLGWLDLLGEITGGGTYQDLAEHSHELELTGTRCKVLDIEVLIATKRAAGRLKDMEPIAELEIIRDELKRN
jgi:predicted nucleotidyltransferase